MSSTSKSMLLQAQLVLQAEKERSRQTREWADKLRRDVMRASDRAADSLTDMMSLEEEEEQQRQARGLGNSGSGNAVNISSTPLAQRERDSAKNLNQQQINKTPENNNRNQQQQHPLGSGLWIRSVTGSGSKGTPANYEETSGETARKQLSFSSSNFRKSTSENIEPNNNNNSGNSSYLLPPTKTSPFPTEKKAGGVWQLLPQDFPKATKQIEKDLHREYLDDWGRDGRNNNNNNNNNTNEDDERHAVATSFAETRDSLLVSPKIPPTTTTSMFSQELPIDTNVHLSLSTSATIDPSTKLRRFALSMHSPAAQWMELCSALTNEKDLLEATVQELRVTNAELDRRANESKKDALVLQQAVSDLRSIYAKKELENTQLKKEMEELRLDFASTAESLHGKIANEKQINEGLVVIMEELRVQCQPSLAEGSLLGRARDEIAQLQKQLETQKKENLEMNVKMTMMEQNLAEAEGRIRTLNLELRSERSPSKRREETVITPLPSSSSLSSSQQNQNQQIQHQNQPHPRVQMILDDYRAQVSKLEAALDAEVIVREEETKLLRFELEKQKEIAQAKLQSTTSSLQNQLSERETYWREQMNKAEQELEKMKVIGVVQQQNQQEKERLAAELQVASVAVTDLRNILERTNAENQRLRAALGGRTSQNEEKDSADIDRPPRVSSGPVAGLALGAIRQQQQQHYLQPYSSSYPNNEDQFGDEEEDEDDDDELDRSKIAFTSGYRCEEIRMLRELLAKERAAANNNNNGGPSSFSSTAAAVVPLERNPNRERLLESMLAREREATERVKRELAIFAQGRGSGEDLRRTIEQILTLENGLKDLNAQHDEWRLQQSQVVADKDHAVAQWEKSKKEISLMQARIDGLERELSTALVRCSGLEIQAKIEAEMAKECSNSVVDHWQNEIETMRHRFELAKQEMHQERMSARIANTKMQSMEDDCQRKMLEDELARENSYNLVIAGMSEAVNLRAEEEKGKMSSLISEKYEVELSQWKQELEEEQNRADQWESRARHFEAELENTRVNSQQMLDSKQQQHEEEKRLLQTKLEEMETRSEADISTLKGEIEELKQQLIKSREQYLERDIVAVESELAWRKTLEERDRHVSMEEEEWRTKVAQTEQNLTSQMMDMQKEMMELLRQQREADSIRSQEQITALKAVISRATEQSQQTDVAMKTLQDLLYKEQTRLLEDALATDTGLETVQSAVSNAVALRAQDMASLAEMKEREKKEQIGKLEAEIVGAKKQVDTLEREKKEVQAELEKWRSRAEEDRKKLDSEILLVPKKSEEGYLKKWKEEETRINAAHQRQIDEISGKLREQMESEKRKLVEKHKADVQSSIEVMTSFERALATQTEDAKRDVTAIVRRLKTEVETLTMERDSARKEAAELEKECTLLRELAEHEVVESKKQSDALIGRLKSEFETLVNQTLIMETQLQESKEKLEKSQETISLNEKELGRYTETVEAKEKEFAACKEKVEAQEKELTSCKETISSQLKELAASRETLSMQDNELRQTVSSQQKEIESCKETIASQEKELAASNETISSQQKELVSCKEQIAILVSELGDVKKDLSDLLSQVAASLETTARSTVDEAITDAINSCVAVKLAASSSREQQQQQQAHQQEKSALESKLQRVTDELEAAQQTLIAERELVKKIQSKMVASLEATEIAFSTAERVISQSEEVAIAKLIEDEKEKAWRRAEAFSAELYLDQLESLKAQIAQLEKERDDAASELKDRINKEVELAAQVNKKRELERVGFEEALMLTRKAIDVASQACEADFVSLKEKRETVVATSSEADVVSKLTTEEAPAASKEEATAVPSSDAESSKEETVETPSLDADLVSKPLNEETVVASKEETAVVPSSEPDLASKSPEEEAEVAPSSEPDLENLSSNKDTAPRELERIGFEEASAVTKKAIETASQACEAEFVSSSSSNKEVEIPASSEAPSKQVGLPPRDLERISFEEASTLTRNAFETASQAWEAAFITSNPPLQE